MHFRKLINSECLAAEDFVDANFQPIERQFTIKGVCAAKPPAGGKEKACVTFEETPKKAFIANGEVKRIARMLRRANTDDWLGAKVVITSAPKRFAGQDTTGMVIVSAELPKKESTNASK